MTTDVLVLAAHPDDAEIGCGGTILGLTDAGRSVAVVDMSRGENATRGTPELRAREAEASAALLRIAERRNLGLPDAGIVVDDAATRAVVREIRRLRPTLMFAPLERDAHPDHEATARIARRALFLAGLQKVFPDLGAPHRPRRLLHYFGNDPAEPTFCVDISALVERKRAAIECFASQIAAGTHFARGSTPLERCEARDRYFGSICGFAAAEPFVADGPLPLHGLDGLLAEPAR